MSHQKEVKAFKNKAQDHFEGKKRRRMSLHQVLLTEEVWIQTPEKSEKNFEKLGLYKLMEALFLIVRKIETCKNPSTRDWLVYMHVMSWSI